MDHPHFGYNTKLTKKVLILTWFGNFLQSTYLYLAEIFKNFVLNFYLADMLKWIHSPPTRAFLGVKILPLGDKKEQGLQIVRGFLRE